MKKLLLPLLLISPLLLGMNKPMNVEENIFDINELKLETCNTRSISFDDTNRGYLIKPAKDYTSTDAFIRFRDIDDVHEVSIASHKFLAIRYRSNYDAKFALRILSTTGSSVWNDFIFDHYSTADSFSNWKTAIYDLSFENAKNVNENTYNTWVEGDYDSISFNITNNALFDEGSYLFLSSFSFFNTYDEASSFKGLSYSQNEDTVGPVIEVPGVKEDTLTTTAGRKFNYSATYYDEYDDLGGEVEGVLSSGAIDENGLLVKGNHIVTFTAYDLSNNSSTKTINLVVGDKDETAPIININIDKLYVLAGSYNKLVFEVYDEVDGLVDYQLTYSVGVINNKGQFLAGNHTLTITAKDETGNTATKTIEIISGYDLNPDGLEIIDEGEN